MLILFLEVWTSFPMSGPVRRSCLPFHNVGITTVDLIGVREMFTGLELEVRFGSKSRITGNRGEVCVNQGQFG
jgi:hypothetical protein